MNKWNKQTDYHFNGYRFFNKNEFYRFMQVNDFLEVQNNVPHNAKKFLITGFNQYKKGIISEYAGLSGLIHHPMMFKNTITNKNCIVLQPYTYSERLDDICKRVKEWAEIRDLQVEIYDSRYSWYYPGMTILIIITAPGTIIQVKKIVDKEHRIDGWNKKAPVNATNIDKSK